MTITNFRAIMKVLGWTDDKVFIGLRYADPTKTICINTVGINTNLHISVRHFIYQNNDNTHPYTNSLIKCKDYEEAIEYISNLDFNILPPNGKNK